jgi:hypothetical protein
MKRPPGRPPLDATSTSPSADIHLTVSPRDFDSLEQLARQRRQSVQDLIRRSVRHLLDHERRNAHD